MIKGAYFSKCRTYRYALWRLWHDQENMIEINGVKFPRNGYVMWIGLNPSTADESVDDPTIRRCISFTKSWGYDGMFMVNLFTYRATDPNEMLAQFSVRADGQNIVGEYMNRSSPVGGCKNAQVVYHLQKKCALVVAAWGANQNLIVKDRASSMCSWFVDEKCPIDRDLHCVAMTMDFSPGHPLYVSAAAQPTLYRQSWSSRMHE